MSPGKSEWLFAWAGAVAITCLIGLTAHVAFTIAKRDCPEPPHTSQTHPQFYPKPPDCGNLYNVGRSEEWRDCMGVGRTPAALRRKDL